MKFQKYSKYNNKNWLYHKYIEEQLSIPEISKICGARLSTIWGWLKKFNIQTRTVGESHRLWHKKHPGVWTREKHPAWKGGTHLCNGYVLVYKPDHPNAHLDGYVFEHRLAMEQKLGRYLYPWETVHHINGVKTDNWDDNLKLLPGKEHNTKIQEIYRENKLLKTIVVDFLSIGENQCVS